MASLSKPPQRRLRRRLLLLLVAALALWFAFFDSHSLFKRVRWHREHAQLIEENEMLRRQIEVLQSRLQQPLSDDVVEQIAREQYGMRRPGETVYRVQPAP